jgi:Fe-S-cluster containining protein
MTPSASVAKQLCLNCGLCCNGVLFKDVELQPGDDAKKLATLGLPLTHPKSPIRNPKTKFPQPCAALCADNRCRIYADRPVRCRDFECALFKSVANGETELPAALRTIRKTIQRAGRVRELLAALGDTDESLALSLRFKRARRRIESANVDETTAETYADLTMAVHELNLLLAQKFYPHP